MAGRPPVQVQPAFRYLGLFLSALALVILFAQLFITSGEVGFVEGLVVYLITWWIVIFVVLPIRITGQHETGNVVEGSEPGAPVDPRLKEKAMLTTVITSALWLVFFAVMELGLVDLNALWGPEFR
jgi:predicted secreted protein